MAALIAVPDAKIACLPSFSLLFVFQATITSVQTSLVCLGASTASQEAHAYTDHTWSLP